MAIEIVEGWGEAIEYKMLADSVAVDLTGYSGGQATSTALSTLVPQLNSRGVMATSTGVIAVMTATCGYVKFTPGSCTDLVAEQSPYTFRIGMRSAGNQVVYFPNGSAEIWTVHSVES